MGRSCTKAPPTPLANHRSWMFMSCCSATVKTAPLALLDNIVLTSARSSGAGLMTLCWMRFQDLPAEARSRTMSGRDFCVCPACTVGLAETYTPPTFFTSCRVAAIERFSLAPYSSQASVVACKRVPGAQGSPEQKKSQDERKILSSRKVRTFCTHGGFNVASVRRRSPTSRRPDDAPEAVLPLPLMRAWPSKCGPSVKYVFEMPPFAQASLTRLPRSLSSGLSEAKQAGIAATGPSGWGRVGGSGGEAAPPGAAAAAWPTAVGDIAPPATAPLAGLGYTAAASAALTAKEC